MFELLLGRSIGVSDCSIEVYQYVLWRGDTTSKFILAILLQSLGRYNNPFLLMSYYKNYTELFM